MDSHPFVTKVYMDLLKASAPYSTIMDKSTDKFVIATNCSSVSSCRLEAAYLVGHLHSLLESVRNCSYYYFLPYL